jgi:hypothetical protein
MKMPDLTVLWHHILNSERVNKYIMTQQFPCQRGRFLYACLLRLSDAQGHSKHTLLYILKREVGPYHTQPHFHRISKTVLIYTLTTFFISTKCLSCIVSTFFNPTLWFNSSLNLPMWAAQKGN